VTFESARFEFSGFGSPGYCYIKALVRLDSIVVLCSQLVGYHGTSVTNGLEDIRDRLIDELRSSGKLGNFQGVSRLTPSIFPFNVYERMAWIEHYPAGTSLGGDPSYAYVRFADGSPAWAYMTIDRAAGLCEVPVAFLEVERERLTYA
jgi:hypothetical protein